MKVIYIAGKYTDNCAYKVDLNIDMAKRYAIKVWQMGAVALCPHTNSAHMEGATSDQGFINGTKELMRRCDAIFVCPNWETSSGTKGEIAEATLLEMPVFYDLISLKKWLEENS